MGAAAVLELSELDGSHRLAYTAALIFSRIFVIAYLAREDRPWLEEGVFLNSVPSTLALASSVAGTAAALQAGKGQIISFHIVGGKQGQQGEYEPKKVDCWGC